MTHRESRIKCAKLSVSKQASRVHEARSNLEYGYAKAKAEMEREYSKLKQELRREEFELEAECARLQAIEDNALTEENDL